jgi:hypothetical protein
MVLAYLYFLPATGFDVVSGDTAVDGLEVEDGCATLVAPEGGDSEAVRSYDLAAEDAWGSVAGAMEFCGAGTSARRLGRGTERLAAPSPFLPSD